MEKPEERYVLWITFPSCCRLSSLSERVGRLLRDQVLLLLENVRTRKLLRGLQLISTPFSNEAISSGTRKSGWVGWDQMEGMQTDWRHQKASWFPVLRMLLLPLHSVCQKQLDLLVPKQNECLKENDEIFLNAYLETIVSTVQIKMPVRLEIKESIGACSVHCVGAGLKRCLFLCCDRQHTDPTPPILFCFRKRLSMLQNLIESLWYQNKLV